MGSQFINQEEFTERINQLIELSKLSPRRFAIEAEIDTSNFSRKLKGTLPWTTQDANKVSSKFNARKGWLLTGEGQMFSVPEEVKEQVRNDVAEMKEKAQNDAVLDVYARCIRQLEDDRADVRNELNAIKEVHQQLADELDEVRNLKAILHDAINAFRNATRTNQYAPLMAVDEG